MKKRMRLWQRFALNSRQRRQWDTSAGIRILLRLGVTLEIIGFPHLAHAAPERCEQHPVAQHAHRSSQAWLLALLAALILVGGFISMAVPTAYASAVTPQTAHRALASCSGPGCNGSDAYHSNCAGNGTSYWMVDSVPVTWKGLNDGWVQLWYSGTCGTNWARYSCSTSCRPVTLTLMVCNTNGSHTGVQGPIELDATGRTKQHSLPTTRASAYVMFNISGTVTSGAETGCS